MQLAQLRKRFSFLNQPPIKLFVVKVSSNDDWFFLLHCSPHKLSVWLMILPRPLEKDGCHKVWEVAAITGYRGFIR